LEQHQNNHADENDSNDGKNGQYIPERSFHDLSLVSIMPWFSGTMMFILNIIIIEMNITTRMRGARNDPIQAINVL
jgi:hypothetical protein